MSKFERPPDDQYVPTPADFEARIASESIEFPLRASVSPRTAAFMRRLGTYVDTASVIGTDTNLLAPEDARFLRDEVGLNVDPQDVEGGVF